MTAFLIYQTVIRVVATLVAMFFGYLGYKLFLNGVNQDPVKISAESKIGKFMVSGQGTGTFFIMTSCVILIVALVSKPQFSEEKTITKGDFKKEIKQSNFTVVKSLPVDIEDDKEEINEPFVVTSKMEVMKSPEKIKKTPMKIVVRRILKPSINNKCIIDATVLKTLQIMDSTYLKDVSVHPDFK